MPIVTEKPSEIADIIFGLLRRLDKSAAVVDRLYSKLLSNKSDSS